MEQEQYSAVWDGMVLDTVWAPNVVKAAEIMAEHKTFKDDAIIVNMTQLLKGA